jgi:hypothetical protein
VSKGAFPVLKSLVNWLEALMLLRVAAAIILAIWAVLLLAGKKGFIHLLLLNGLGLLFTDALVIYRTRMKKPYFE